MLMIYNILKSFGTLYCIIPCLKYICIIKSNFYKIKSFEYMNIENTQSQMRKGVLEYCILSIIKKGEAYPGDIIEEMKNAGLQLLEGTLYPLLNRLKNAGVLSYHWVESTSGPPRKYFSLTEKGVRFYKLLETTWNELATGVETLTRNVSDDINNVIEDVTEIVEEEKIEEIEESEVRESDDYGDE